MRLFKIILAAVILIVNTAHGTQVLEFYPSGSSENRSDGSTIDHGIYINSNGDYQAKLPFEAVVFFPDRHSAYCMAQKNSSTGTPYMQIVEENLRISPDGGMVEGEVLGTRVSLDALPPSLDKEGYSAAYKVKNKNAAGKDGGGDAPAGAPTGSPDGFASESGLMSIQTVSDVAKSAVTAGVFTGVVTAAYRGMLIDSGTAADNAKLQTQINQLAQGTVNYQRQTFKVIADSYRKAYSAFNGPNLDFSNLRSTNLQYEFRTTNSDIKNELIENRLILENIHTLRPKESLAKQMGLSMNTLADESYATGDNDSGRAFLKYARVFADAAVGLDPISGPIRDVFEAFTGQNMITGEKLDDFSRTFAFVGAVSFGFGSKIAKGVRFFGEARFLEKLTRPISKAFYSTFAKIASGNFLHLSSDYRRALRNEPELIKKVISMQPERTGEFVKITNATADFVIGIKKGPIKVRRIIMGKGERVVVLGREMGYPREGKVLEGVTQAVDKLKKAGVSQAEYIQIPESLESEIKNIFSEKGRKLTDPELVKTETYLFNKGYVEKAIHDGATIVDLGNPHDLPYSTFYDGLEQGLLKKKFGEP